VEEPDFVVVPGNPFDTTVESLDPLLAQLRQEGSTAEVRVREERGYGVTFIEVVLLYVAYKAMDKVVDRALDRTVDKAESAGTRWWAKRRLERRNRPATVLICDEDGNVLRSLECRPEDVTPLRSDAAKFDKRLPLPPATAEEV